MAQKNRAGLTPSPENPTIVAGFRHRKRDNPAGTQLAFPQLKPPRKKHPYPEVPLIKRMLKCPGICKIHVNYFLIAAMTKSSLTLSKGWHFPAVFVLICFTCAPYSSMTMPLASTLAADGNLVASRFFHVLNLAMFIIALIAFLPFTGNQSKTKFVRVIGRFSLGIRLLVVIAIDFCLFWLGILIINLTA